MKRAKEVHNDVLALNENHRVQDYMIKYHFGLVNITKILMDKHSPNLSQREYIFQYIDIYLYIWIYISRVLKI